MDYSMTRSGLFAPANRVMKSGGWGQVVNADIDSAAAIAYSKLNLATSIVNADIAAAAAIALSKLAPGSSGVLKSNGTTISAGNLITSSDITDGTIVNGDINASAAIDLTKLGSMKYAIVQASTAANQSIPNATWTDVNFDGTDVADANNWHNPASNPQNITVSEAGVYLVCFNVFYTGGYSGENRWFGIAGLTGASNLIQQQSASDPFTSFYAQVGSCVASANIKVQTYQNAGVARDLNNSWGHRCTVVKLGNS